MQKKSKNILNLMFKDYYYYVVFEPVSACIASMQTPALVPACRFSLCLCMCTYVYEVSVSVWAIEHENISSALTQFLHPCREEDINQGKKRVDEQRNEQRTSGGRRGETRSLTQQLQWPSKEKRRGWGG